MPCSSGEPRKLPTAGIELGTDVGLPRVEVIGWREVVIVQHQRFGASEQVVSDG